MTNWDEFKELDNFRREINGILTLRVPKAKNATPKRIDVHVG